MCVCVHECIYSCNLLFQSAFSCTWVYFVDFHLHVYRCIYECFSLFVFVCGYFSFHIFLHLSKKTFICSCIGLSWFLFTYTYLGKLVCLCNTWVCVHEFGSYCGVSMCVCMCVYECMYIFVRLYLSVYVCVCFYLCVWVCTYLFVYVWVCVYLWVVVFVCVCWLVVWCEGLCMRIGVSVNIGGMRCVCGKVCTLEFICFCFVCLWVNVCLSVSLFLCLYKYKKRKII